MTPNDECSLVPSPSRTYVVFVNIEGFTKKAVKKFTLPESYKNTVNHATWYFYNMVSAFHSGGEAIPFEQYSDLQEME